ncbi:hypothetical protein GH733_007817 [Mirounga leonina]|nr:hypothetical protein GH733_007817 [Mirounga leonina]
MAIALFGATESVVTPGLSQEEALQKKFNQLKEKKKALLAPKTQSSTAEPARAASTVPARAAWGRPGHGDRAADSCVLMAKTKNSGFRCSRTLVRKLKDPEKGPAPNFQLFQRSISSPEKISV